ncbi:MAG: RHS repeat-associated core domain-containing protein [Planctomycetes bacterium]|nr:RHS repeat-associated core domain-containing protein [Planctomycetota bacterium]
MDADAGGRFNPQSAIRNPKSAMAADGLGRRIAKLVPNGNNWDRTDYYCNEAWQCLEERCGANQQSKDTVAAAVKVQHLWDVRYVDAPVLRWRDTGGDPDLDETLYFCNDANMNVTALVDGTAGSQTEGEVVERVVYDPYGKPKFYDASWANPADSSAYANEILYCGYRFDPETGLYHVRHRHYHPTLGRWLQRDPAGHGAGINLSEYVSGFPIGYRDPGGLAGEPDFEGALRRAAPTPITVVKIATLKGYEGRKCERAADEGTGVHALAIYRAHEFIWPTSNANRITVGYYECTVELTAICVCNTWKIPVLGITVWSSYDWAHLKPFLVVAYNVRIDSIRNTMARKLSPYFDSDAARLEGILRKIKGQLKPDLALPFVNPKRFWPGEAAQLLGSFAVPESISQFVESHVEGRRLGDFDQTESWLKLDPSRAETVCLK